MSHLMLLQSQLFNSYSPISLGDIKQLRVLVESDVGSCNTCPRLLGLAKTQLTVPNLRSCSCIFIPCKRTASTVGTEVRGGQANRCTKAQALIGGSLTPGTGLCPKCPAPLLFVPFLFHFLRPGLFALQVSRSLITLVASFSANPACLPDTLPR